MRCSLLALSSVVIPLIAWGGPVDINTADAATLARELAGVGDSRAQAIIDYRTKNGRFATPEDLLKVSGIGQQVLNLNRDNIRVGGPARPAAKAPQ